VSAAEQRVRDAYAAFNAHDADGALAHMQPDVDWPTVWEGGRAVGHDAVRDYWTRQWAEIDPQAQPLVVRELPDGRVHVDVLLVVRDGEGRRIGEQHVVHVFTLRDGLVARMDVADPGRPAPQIELGG
jgi:hypothetical protein